MAKPKKADFIQVLTVNSEIEAEMVRGALETSGIPAFVQRLSLLTEAIHPVDISPEYCILVPKNRKLEAEDTIASSMEKGQDN